MTQKLIPSLPLLASLGVFAFAQLSCSSSDTGGSGPSTSGSSTTGGSSTGAAGSSSATSGASSGGGNNAAMMSFFVTSKGLGTGGNLGGLDGADAHCRTLAAAAGSPKTKWFAYLSIKNGPGGMPVNARDRIGTGPWYNSKGVLIASSVEQLHSNMGMDNALGLMTSLDEAGNIVPGRNADTRPPGTQNEHDILTGSNVDGTMFETGTCSDWTSAETTVIARVGHSDKDGPTGRIQWNAAHESSGCAEGRAMGGVGSGGGSGRLYCFAAD